MATPRVVLTYEDYLALPDDGRHHQILDGELFVTASPVPLHQRILGRLYATLAAHVESRRLGEVLLSPIAVILAHTTVVEPDLVYLETARARMVSERGVEGAPTLLVEILSPSTARIDRGAKFQLYARYRVPHYWIIDPRARTIEAYELADEGYHLTMTAAGAFPVSLPPFLDLALVPDSLWPPA